MILHAGEEKYEISPKRILNVEAIAVKRKIGLDYQAWMEAMSNFDPEALTAFVWIAKRRMEPTFRYEDVSFELGSIEFELNDEEKAEMEAANSPKAEDAPTPETIESA